jgi:hypothetical protein
VLGKSRVSTGHSAHARVEIPDVGIAIDEKPKSVYEVMTRQMLEQVKADVHEVKSRVNTLLWLVIGAMLMELLMRVVK